MKMPNSAPEQRAGPPADVDHHVSMTARPTRNDDSGLFGWWRDGTLAGKRAFIAASMAWGLDAFDVMLFSLTLPEVIKELGLTKTQAGALGSVTLLGAAAGGLIFGHIADR